MADRKEDILIDITLDGPGEAAVSAISTIENLTRANKELREERKKVNLDTADGKKRVAEINQELDKNTKVIKENSSALEKQRMNVGAYKDAIDKALPGLGGFLNGMQSLINPITAVGAGVGALVSLYAKSTIGSKDLEFASSQLSFAITSLGDSFASLFSSSEDGEGFFSTILSGLLTTIDPATAAISKLAAMNVEKLQDLGREAKGALSDQQELLADNAELLQKAADSQVNYNDKIFLTNQAIDNIRKAETNVLAVRQEELKVLKDQSALFPANEAFQDAVLDKELQINQEKKKADRLVNNIIKLQDNLKVTEESRISNIQKQNEKLIEQRAILQSNEQFEKDTQKAREELAADAEFQRLLLAANGLLPEEELTELQDLQLEILEDGSTRILDKKKATDAAIIKYNEEKNKKIAADEKKMTKLSELEEQQRLLVTSNTLGLAASAFKKHTVAYKVFASAQTIIDTYQGATAAFRAMASIPVVGPVLGAIAAAATIAAGLANLAQINAVQFARGGYTGEGGMWEPAGVVHKGEVVWSQADVARSGGPDAVDRMRPTYRDLQPYALGGIVANETRFATSQAQQQLDLNQIGNIINQVRTVLVLQDFEAAQQAKNQPISTSQVIG